MRCLAIVAVLSACATRAPVNDPARQKGCSGGVETSEITFPAPNEPLTVHGTLEKPCGAERPPVVVLAHQMCMDRKEWSEPEHDWVTAFHKRGIATLAIDLRGHGASQVWPDG